MKDTRKTKKQSVKPQRKRAEEALRESEGKYKTLIEQALEGIVIAQGSPPRLVFANSTMKTLLGYTVKELLSFSFKKLENLIYPDDRALFFGRYKDRMQGKAAPSNYEFRAVKKDGTVIWMEISSRRIEYYGELAVQATFTDVTERKRMETALKESEQKLRFMFESVGDAITLTDLQGRIIDLNRAAVKTFGLKNKEEAIGLEGFKFVAAKSYDVAMRDMAGLLGKGVIGSKEYTLQTADGRGFEAESTTAILRDDSGGPIGFVSINRDITERKQAEEALQRSEEKFKAIFDSANDGILLADVETKKFNIGNKAICNMLGYSLEEIRNLGVRDIHPKEVVPYAIEQFEKLVTGEVVKVRDLPVKRKDGSIFYADINSVVLELEGKKYLAGIFHNTTERKRAEEALRESEQRYRAIVENSGEVIFSLDTQGSMTYISPAIERLGGYTPDEVTGTRFTRYVVPEDLPGLLASMERTLAGQREPYEFRVVCKDGTIRRVISSSNPIVENGKPVGLTGVISDITEREWLEDVLRFSEEKYRRLVETLNEGIWQIDKDAITTYVNPRMAELLGYEISEMIGAHLFDFMDEQGIDIAKRYLKRRELGIAEQHEFEFIRKDGKRIHALLSTSSILDEDGEYGGAIAAVQDITERKRAEQELRIKDSAIASSINAVTLTDLGGIITYVNDSFLKLWGYADEKEVLGRHITEMWKRGKQAVAIFEAALSKGGSRGELEAMRKDGSSFVAQIASSLVTDKDGKPVCALGSYIDVTERRHAEESLRKERDRAQTYLDIAEVMMVVVDADEKVSLVNKKGCEVLGCRTKEIIGKNWFDSFIPERMRERLRGLTRKVIAGEGELMEYYEGRVVTASGEERIVAWHNSMIVSEDGKFAGIMGSGVDITERKQAEEERGKLLQQLNQRVKELDCLYGISNVLALQNISAEKIFNGIVVLVPQACRYPEVACAKIHVGDEDFTTKNFRETEWKLSQDITAHGERAGCVEVYYLEQRPEAVKGPFLEEERHLIEAVAKRLGDAIERKEAKQTLRESEEKLRLMFETVSDGIIVSDAEGRITEANEAAVRMHGFADKEELIGRHGFDFIAEKDRARAREDMKKALESGQALDTATYTFVDSAGKKFEMEYRTSILYNGSGRMLGFLCAMRDVTGRRRG